MCGSSPNLSPEANKARCYAGCVLGFSIVAGLGIGGIFGIIVFSFVVCLAVFSFKARGVDAKDGPGAPPATASV